MLNDTLIFNEFRQIASRPLPKVYWKLEAEILAGPRVVRALKVERREIIRDYADQYGDEAYLTVLLGMVTYKDLVLPQKKNLKVRLIRTLQNDEGHAFPGAERQVAMFDAHLINSLDIDMTSPGRGYEDTGLNELSQLLPITFQLVDTKLTEMRMVSVSGVHYGTNQYTMLKTLFGYDLNTEVGSDALKSPSYTGVRGVEVIAPQNTATYDELEVPSNMRLTQLPAYLQKTYGVYSSGINRYYQAGYWYVYPLYDYNRFKTTARRLTIINIPSDELAAPERSYDVRAEQVFILATGDTKILDSSERTMQNLGNGMRFARADKLVDGMAGSSGNRATPKTDDTQRGFVVEERADGLTDARMGQVQYTNNPYPQLSEMAKGLGRKMILQWENADPSLLYPAMPVKILYRRGKELKAVVGTLLGVRIKEQPGTKMFSDTDYRCSCVLVVHVKKEDLGA